VSDDDRMLGELAQSVKTLTGEVQMLRKETKKHGEALAVLASTCNNIVGSRSFSTKAMGGAGAAGAGVTAFCHGVWSFLTGGTQQ